MDSFEAFFKHAYVILLIPTTGEFIHFWKIYPFPGYKKMTTPGHPRIAII